MSTTRLDRLELWEDGRRIPEAYRPGAFDWWYFDAHLSDDSSVVFVFHIDQDYKRDSFVYRVWAELVRPDGERVLGQYSTHDDAEFSSERPDVRIGKSTIRGDLDEYHVVVDEGDIGNLGLDVTFRRACPPRVSPANRDNILDAAEAFGWVCVVPRGELTGTLTLGGEPTEVEGTVYHDKNWGTASMGSLLHHWVWFRGAIGPYTAVFFAQYPNEEHKPAGFGAIHELFVASEDEILVNIEGPDATQLTAPVEPSPDPRNESSYWTPNAKVEAEQNGTRVILEAQTAHQLSSIDLAKETRYLTMDEIARAKEMDNRPWYSRFKAGPVSLSINGEEQSGEGVIEFMDFHLRP